MEEPQRPPLELAGRVAVVTGAASGIGRATAIYLKSQGARISAVDVALNASGESSSPLDPTEADLIWLRADITQEEDIASAIESTVQHFGRVDILVNAAAAFVQEGVDATADQWWKVLATNLIGTALCSRYASLEMRKQRRGSIINVGSTSGLTGQGGYATYSASKAGVASLTQCLAVDLGVYGIRVICVSPGATDTPALRKAVERTGMDFHTFEQTLFERQCISILTVPEEIAAVIAFLASDRAAAVTGSNLIVDRGLFNKA